MGTILLIDDNEAYCQQIQKTLALRGFELRYETDPHRAIQLAFGQPWDVILLDVVFQEDFNGLQVLEKIKETKPNLPVILVSAASTLELARQAVAKGAFDYLDKPINVDRMTMTIKHAVEQRHLMELNQNLFDEFYKTLAEGTLSASVQQILELFNASNETWERILLWGEKGTGKELLAKVLHFNSKRKYGPFISFYCDSQNVEAEARLFGTSSQKEANNFQKSLINQANNGTLFIGEIFQLSQEGQQRLARFIHENYYMPGSEKDDSQFDIRLITSTSTDLNELVREGRFSEELFHYFNTLTFRLPPLRERIDDIPLLAEHFLAEMNGPYYPTQPKLSKGAIEALQAYAWPGNISELKTVMWLLAFFNRSPKITKEDVKSALQFYNLMRGVKEDKNLDELQKEFSRFFALHTKRNKNVLEKAKVESNVEKF